MHTRRQWFVGRSVMLGCALIGAMGCNSAPRPEEVSHTAQAVFNPVGGTFFQGTVALSSRGVGTLDFFMNSLDVQPYHRSYDNGWSPQWVPLPPIEAGRRFFSNMTAVSWSTTRIDVFVTDELGRLLHNWTNGGDNWSPAWETVATLNECVTGCWLASSSWGPNRLDVFAIPGGSSRQIVQITYDNGWQAPATGRFSNPPGLVPSMLSAVSWGPGRIDLVASTGNFDDERRQTEAGDVVQYFTNDGANWSGPWDLGVVGQGFAVLGHPFNVAVTSWGPNVLDVLSTFDGQVAQRSFRPTTGWDPGWTISTMQAPLPSLHDLDSFGIAAVSWGPGRIDLTGTTATEPPAADLESWVWHDWFNTSAPAGWFGTEILTAHNNCLVGWQTSGCAQSCLSRTQSDQMACSTVLNCFRDNFCGPSTCATGSQVCGPNVLGFGNAPYPWAQTVMNCIGFCDQ